MWIATVAEMREIERLAEVDHGLTPEVLMDNAGQAVFDVAAQMSGSNKRIVVVCGKGNNGGDGFVVARLAKEAGFEVKCLVPFAENDLSALCRRQFELSCKSGVGVEFEPRKIELGFEFDAISGAAPGVIVDALFGTGLQSEPTGTAARMIDAIRQDDTPVLAVDVPSGIASDTGKELGRAVRATRTVVLGLAKPYLFQGSGSRFCGHWAVADLGLSHFMTKAASLGIESKWISLPRRGQDSNKGDNGHVLVVAGSRQYRGAATLSTLGALKAGAGLVTVAAIEPVIESVAAQVPEAMYIVLPEENGSIAADAALTVRTMMGKVTSAVFGPGLTQAVSVRDFLKDLWQDWWIPSVIDADALNLVASGLDLPMGLNILTPHPGEAARLLGTDVSTVQSDRFRSARALHEKYGWPVILKGANSVLALADIPLLVNTTGNSGMGTGGMGDVLSGMLGTLNQPQEHPAKTCATAMFWHGLAGDLAAKEIGEIGFSASDLAHFLPRARSILTK